MRVIAIIAIALLATSAIAAPAKPPQDVVDKIQLVLDKRKAASAKAADLRGKADKLEEEIGLRDSAGRLRPIDDAGVVEYAKRLLGLGAEKYEEYAGQIQAYKLAQEEFRSLTAQAIMMANAEYGSAPAKSAGNIASGPPMPQSDDDVPGYIGNHVTISPKYSALLPKNTWGSTDDAGNVLIGEDAFGSPGRLAFTLYHEGEHFENLLTPGLDLRNNPNEEVLARTKQRPLLKSTFGLTDDEIARFDEKLESERKRARNWDTALTQGLTPYKRSHQDAFPKGYKPLWLEDGVTQEVENILARTKELREQERAETERRRLEAEETERARRAAAEWRMTQYQYAARQCGLTPMMTAHNQTLGFRVDQAVNVYFTEPVTLDQAKAGLLMTRACLFGESGKTEDQPCADVLGAMRANWGDAGFKHGLELDADAGNIDGCLRAIRENGDAPKDMRALNKRVTKYWKDWNVAAKRREMETMREYRRQQEESGRRARGDAEERSGRVPDQNYDLTAPRRALDEARRSHF